MIIPMKKVTLLCLEQDKESALENLRSLGLMQLSFSADPSGTDIEKLKRALSDTDRAEGIVRSAAGDPKHKNASETLLNGERLTERILELADRRTAVQKDLDTLERDRETLEPWGDFSYETLSSLRDKGVFVTLCVTRPERFRSRQAGENDSAFPENATVKVIYEDKSKVCYALISPAETEQPDPDSVRLPAMTLAEIRMRSAEARKELHDIETELFSFHSSLETIAGRHTELAAKLEFEKARVGMTQHGAIGSLSGYVPETELENLRDAALRFGWALLILDPDRDDEKVPTYIRKPKFLNIMDPLFDFIGVQPGYRENDVNVFFFLFFPIFFGMILGDAGYAVAFLVIAFVCKWVFRSKEAARLPLNLFILLSFAALVWGWLNGAWFGVPRTWLPPFMQGWNLLADPQNSPFAQKLVTNLNMIRPDMTQVQIQAMWDGLPGKFIQYFCFLLAALHLGSARVFKFIDEIPHTILAFGHLGWACLIVANFFMAVNLIVFPDTFPKVLGYSLYIAGFVLVCATIRGTAVLNLPFSLIGSFTDVLSYIRLFAVGLASTYIAVNFNKMGAMLMNALPDSLMILGIVFLVFVALFGHLLNIALGFLSVMVHGIRLNTLEFSNHVEMQWSGTKFEPFSKPVQQETNSHT